MEGVEKNKVRRRQRYLGPTITPKNRKQYLENYRNQFYQQAAESETYKDMEQSELDEIAEVYAKLEIARERKHFQAWRKGNRSYKFRGKFFMVLASQLEEEVLESELQNSLESNESDDRTKGDE